MADKYMYILNIHTQYYPFCRLQLWLKRLDTQLNEPTNKNSLKVPKLVDSMSKKTLIYDFGN